MAFFIDVIDPSGKSDRVFLSENPVVVGRSQSCNITVGDTYVSGRHVEFWADSAGNCYGRDLNSSNGTKCNGQEMQASTTKTFQPGDRIDLADGKAIITISRDEVGVGAKNRFPAPEGTVTFMFTDMQGSTDLVRDLGDIKSREIFRIHEEVLTNAILENEGYVVKEQGDGFMAAFDSSRAGILSAVSVQKTLKSLREENPDLPIYVRIGLNTGETIIENDDYFGRAVNEAARISAQAGSGEILVSSVSKRMADSAGDIEFGEPRELDLKGLPGNHVVHPVTWEIA
jgi:class 3 adenylate cyclase